MSRQFLTSRSYHRSAQSGLVESGKCCIFVRYRPKWLAEAKPGVGARERGGGDCHSLSRTAFALPRKFPLRPREAEEGGLAHAGTFLMWYDIAIHRAS